jgi:hypothetical protein
MKRGKIFTSTVLALGLASFAQVASASSHREAPAISKDPAADNTDVWAWADKDGIGKPTGKLNVVVGYNPLEEPSGGPNFHEFSDEVLYEVHVTKGDQTLRDYLTYQIVFRSSGNPRVGVDDMSAGPGGGKEFFAQLGGNKQIYSVTRLRWTYDDDNDTAFVDADTIIHDAPVAPVNIGPRTAAVCTQLKCAGYDMPGATGQYSDQFAATFIRQMDNGGRVFAGPRDDAFYVDLGGVFDLANIRPKGTAQDGVSGYNVHAIALELPVSEFQPDNGADYWQSDSQLLGVWASASRRQVTVRDPHGFSRARTRPNGRIKVTGDPNQYFDGSTRSVGPWKQVSRLGLPLINEAVIGLQDKDLYNSTSPATDVQNFAPYFLNPIIVRDAEAVGIYKALSVPQDTTDALKTNRLDILDVINLKSLGHEIPLTATGDVLRIDLNQPAGFPNGRSLDVADRADGDDRKEQADVTDVLLSVLLSKGTIAVSDGVDYNDKHLLHDFPYMALPWSGYNEGHGKPTP